VLNPAEILEDESVSRMVALAAVFATPSSESDRGCFCVQELCMATVIERRQAADDLAAYLTQAARLAEPPVIRFAGDSELDHGASTVDIELDVRGPAAGAGEIESAALLIAGLSHPRLVAADVPWNEVRQRLSRLVRAYQVERCGRDTFRTWASNLSTEDLRARLGFTDTDVRAADRGVEAGQTAVATE
jgi:hypothetical protein